MLRDYLSADTFKRGIVHYLQTYSYKNTKNEDLWNSMASVSMFLCISALGIDRLIIILGVCFFLHHINPSEKNHEGFLQACLRVMCIFSVFRFALQTAHKGWRAFALGVNIHLHPQ